MEQAAEITRPGIIVQLVNSNITARNDVNVRFNNPELSILKGLMTSLNPVISASYNSYEARQRSECFPNTRVHLLNEIETWIKGDSHQAPIYVLDGVAGIGKSTVAQTIATKAAELGLLGASFFFSRDEDLRKIARHFFPTIAYQLSCYDNTFATRLSHSLDQNPDAPGRILPEQLSLLLLKPLQELLLQRASPVLIVIDALDECEETNAEELLTLFGRHIHQMEGLKVLITSRPEVHLRHVLDEDGKHEKFRLHEIEESIVHSDIRLYLQSQLSVEEICKVPRHRRTTWQPTDEDMETLCGICGTLFIIAATAIRFVLGSNNSTPQKQLSRFLDGVSAPGFTGSKYNDALDNTYTCIISAALSGREADDREWLRDLNRVLGALITLANTLPCVALASLLELEPNDLEATLSQLHSLVAPTGSGADMTYRIHHKSFPDFITDRGRIQHILKTWKLSICPDLDSLLWVDVVDQHLQLAKACFRIMDCKLKWNMAGIKEADWYKDKDDIPHVRPELIPRELAYAAMQWASHLRSAQRLNDDVALQMYVDGWASRHILSWIETMVILDRVSGIYEILQNAIKSLMCIPERACQWMERTRVLELLSDACRFVQQGSEVMKISPMHIYRSCLPFVPIETSLFKVYSTTATLRVGLRRSNRWNPLFATLIGHSGSVESVAFSEDGCRVASGSRDRTVRLWDANAGAHLFTLTGHSGWIRSVAFPGNGSRVASGSDDQTIRLWDTNSGAHLLTLTGHSSWIRCVAFSSDGSRMASGSNDRTIRLWDVNTGVHLSTFCQHSKFVRSVVFFGDGLRVASGSNGKTIQLWDTNTGTNLLTLHGHSKKVRSVALSRDGSRVASGSYDETIRLWDTNTGTHLSTLTGQSGKINSVAFSVCGSRVASGSDDYTIRLWDTNSGAHLFTLTGHSDWVNSVAFSGDGSRVASGSHDNTVRLWDTKIDADLSILNVHSSWIYSVAFSGDGSRVASGFNDGKIRLWDANTGAHLSTLCGHSNTVDSVAFSWDSSRLASGSADQTIRLWDANTGVNIATLTGHLLWVTSVVFCRDGAQLGSGSADGTIRLWDAKTGAHLSTLTGHSEWVNSVAFSGDSSRLASGSLDNTIRLWDAKTCAHHFTLIGHSDSVDSVAFSADGSQLVSGSDDKTIRLWDANTGAPLSTLTLSMDTIMSDLILVNDSKMIDQLISSTSGLHPLQCRVADPTSVLLLIRRENPSIIGIIMANLVADGRNDIRWEAAPVCWFLPDIGVRCWSVDRLNSRLAIGCKDGRVMTLDILSHCFNHE